ncbi:wall-associated receptor kinase 5-like isoform X2 [Magnolia sinica]|uniref:wall-associated receptor kinase 5-like isoform X2 n=1 Tax=Magnolia sinica TaxID=86752 RepID=UPI002659EB0D|nr:wall-associated receptor kinase 5-like isoform X2 [Magnolia sinica]
MKTRTVSVLPLLILFSFYFRSSHSKGMKLPRNCIRQCGDIDITYPFGIEEGCYLEGYKVTCNDKDGPPVLTLDQVQLPIKKIELPEKVILLIKGRMAVDKQITARNGSQLIPGDSSTNTSNANCIQLQLPFTVSGRWTKFVALGCDTKAYVNTTNFVSGCEYQWTLGKAGDTVHGGLGHCRSMIPDGHTRFCYNVTNFFNYINSSCVTRYSFAGLVEDEYHFNESLLMNFASHVNSTDQLGLPLAAIWAMEDLSGSKCGSNTVWNISRRGSGYVCYCKDGGDGNPYLDGKGGCRHEDKDPGLIYALAGLGLAVSLLGASWSYGSFLEKKLAVIRHETFIQNGGPILQNFINQASNAAPVLPTGAESGLSQAASTGLAPPTTGTESALSTQALPPPTGSESALVNAAPSDQNPQIFNQENLEKAIKLLKKGSDLVMRIRQGRRSTGRLPDDRKIDMRPFKMEEKEERQPFLKEIMTLCRVKHLNVVKLLGCCLETKPDQWLVYEYVSDLTLYDYLHANADPETQLRWKDLLKIAKGTARALADLHAISVWHRDVRSSNILLDENGNPKVVEFGVARVLSSVSYVNQTIGYLDPEYTHTKQLTEKSDVYSFGVVLVELLTGQDPNSDESKKKGGSLTMHFISEMNQNRLEFVVQDGLPEEAGMDQLQELAKLAEDCLKFSGKERPAMNEVMGRLCLIGDGDEQGADGAPEQGGEGEEENGEDGNGPDPGEIYSKVQETVGGEGSSMTVDTFTQFLG